MRKPKTTKTYRRSKQRERILELLRDTESHPTADWLYAQLKREFPNLSLGTIYRNLSILYEQGLIRKINFNSTFDRFEAKVAPHYHLICDNCGRVLDFAMPMDEELNARAKMLTDFTIQRHKIEFFGLCRQCKMKS
ncbi:transcriptional repressor [candidate division KSB1 bacterium]|nr:transcriptional repressor [candidate division KSB1 bacterium]